MYTAAMNPVQNTTVNIAGIITGAAYLTIAAPVAAIGHMFATLLPAILWLLRTLIADSRRMDKPTRLALALCVVAAGVMLAPALTGCVLLLAVFAVVTKP